MSRFGSALLSSRAGIFRRAGFIMASISAGTSMMRCHTCQPRSCLATLDGTHTCFRLQDPRMLGMLKHNDYGDGQFDPLHREMPK